MPPYYMVVRQDEPARIPDNTSTCAKAMTTQDHQGGQHLLDEFIDTLCKCTVEIHFIFCLAAGNMLPTAGLFSFSDHDI